MTSPPSPALPPAPPGAAPPGAASPAPPGAASPAASPAAPFAPPFAPRVAFIHLDLGIGGAESLMLSMAECLPPSHVTFYTCHCDPAHCYDQVKAPGGALAARVLRRGAFLPAELRGRFTALLSHARVLFLALCLLLDTYILDRGRRYDVVLVDVLPTPLPLLRLLLPAAATLYYCHFPDKYLVRNTVNGRLVERASLLRRLYRLPVDALENLCTKSADLTAVNSRFTAATFESAFPDIPDAPTVLYPAINLSQFIPPAPPAAKAQALGRSLTLLSMNRFERKKNVGLALEAFGLLRDRLPGGGGARLVVAGGYDPRNKENLEYMEELKGRARELGIERHVDFRPSVSDEERADLLQCEARRRESTGGAQGAGAAAL